VGVVERDRVIDGSRIAEGDAIVGFPSAGLHANGFTLVRRVLDDEDYDGDDLLAPTRVYLDEVRRLRDRADVRGLAHVTGGGILGNVSRVLPDGVRAEIDWESWERPAVFGWLARHVEEEELRRVFNLGIGYAAVVPEPAEELVIGRVVAG
jgi:phosphoribosylformylglycinamidine cyclo-ligase